METDSASKCSFVAHARQNIGSGQNEPDRLRLYGYRKHTNANYPMTRPTGAPVETGAIRWSAGWWKSVLTIQPRMRGDQLNAVSLAEVVVTGPCNDDVPNACSAGIVRIILDYSIVPACRRNRSSRRIGRSDRRVVPIDGDPLPFLLMRPSLAPGN